MKIAILPNMTHADAPQTSLRVCAKLDELRAAYLISEQYQEYFTGTAAQFLPPEAVLEACDLLLTVGGDGSIIHAAKQAADRYGMATVQMHRNDILSPALKTRH